MRALPLPLALAVAYSVALGCAHREINEPDAGSLDAGAADGGACGSAVCGPAQQCDRTVTPPACVELCDAPAGCRPGWETCNAQSGTCGPVACGSATCQLGQGCFDPATLVAADGASSACTCLPKLVDAATGSPVRQDSCAPYGGVCPYDASAKAAAACRKPLEFESCLAAAGCASGLGCVTTSSGGLCLQTCSRGGDCKSITEYCEVMDGHCWINECARPDQRAAERERYLKPCASAGAADGTCLPVMGSVGEVGLCFQGGSAPSHGACDLGADRAEPSGLCPVGELCLPGSGADGGGAQGACWTACDPAADAGAPCESGERCQDVSGAASPYQGAPGRLGACISPSPG